MATRRSFLNLMGAGFFALLECEAFAAEVDEIPQLENRADFSGAWENLEVGSGLAPYIAPTLKPEYVRALSAIQISSSAQISKYFQEKTGKDFIDWFNASVSGGPIWKDKKITGDDKGANFARFWDSYVILSKPTMLEFVTYMAVFINEVGGNLKPFSEHVNSLTHSLHPGIAYLFDSIEMASPTGRWKKKSYNGGANKTCFELFQNARFVEQFKSLRFADVLGRTSDPVWGGTIYPKSNYPYSASQQEAGIILECDFYKYRGRGLIQTTWRKNYEPLVDFIRQYNGRSDVLKSFQISWAKLSKDDILTLSSNKDWEAIFEDPTRDILTYAVWVHAKGGNYMPLAKQADDVNGTGKGSIAQFGDRLGGLGYGQRLLARVSSTCDALFS
jgi:hypothetical protein